MASESKFDCRVYVPDSLAWKAHVLTSWDKVYCFGKHPGEDFHHAVLHGEVYLRGGDDEVYCLTCAVRLGIATRDRLFWQHPRPPKESDSWEEPF